mmetsp:Transcript_64646/g.189128  ORF Transcript_64646/g.189128 Transcript_64646/m.189128 type:complete len:543 (-) Transcript_64646:67-1695(-)
MLCSTFDTINSSLSGAGKAMAASLRLPCDFRSVALFVAAVLCAVLPLEVSHLASAFLGALGYLVIQTLQSGMERRSVDKTAKQIRAPPARPRLQHGSPSSCPSPSVPRNPTVTGRAGQAATRPRGRVERPCGPLLGPPPGLAAPGAEEKSWRSSVEVRRPSAMPVAAPTFEAVGWEAEVSELLGRIAPTTESDMAVAQIARDVKKAIRSIIPEAEVAGFASGSLASGTAFGVAVPEVDIVISASPAALMGRLQGRWTQSQNGVLKIDTRKLQKSAIRACTNHLVGTNAFKFRRSAFRGQEPKVTMIAPSPTAEGQGIPVNISVNAVTPLYKAALMTECGQLDPRAKELILLVKRWAKDRGLCHAAKGHLSPYAWTLIAIFFLQAGAKEPSLPPLDLFPTSSGLMKKGSSAPRTESPKLKACDKSAGALFKDFITFYAREFIWEKEVISVRLGRRGPPDVSVPLHIILLDDATTMVGPSIEDPFEDSQNIGECMTASSYLRLQEELQRADKLCSQPGTSLTLLLEPWAPPERDGGEEAEGCED